MPQLIRDDATIHYEVEGQGPPVLLIQGVGVIGAGWRPQIEGLREVYGRDVALLPIEETSTIIASGGFAQPVLFLQTGLIHAWYARKSAV